MTLSKKPYKGARDFYPEDKRLQKYMFGRLRQSVELFGYTEYDAPILEALDLYLAKTGEEIINEQTYSFTDRGGREVALRPEMTPSVSRMVAARRQELAYPLRWYSIPNLWRYERPQRGRLREHWQLNVDIFGVADVSAEIEIIQVADQIFKDLGARSDMFEIHLNSRQLMDFIFREYLKLNAASSHDIAKIVDRMHKVSETVFISQVDAVLSAEAKAAGVTERLLEVLQTNTLDELPPAIADNQAVVALQTMTKRLEQLGIHNVRFDITLMRGFDYYTDIVFEIFDTHPDNNRSMLGGGRYDGLVGLFDVSPVPTVGFGLGDTTLANFLELHGLLPVLKVETEIYCVVIGNMLARINDPLARLRQAGVNVALDMTGKKVGEQLKTAAKNAIPYALIIGEDELKSDRYTLRDLTAGTEQKLTTEAIARLVKGEEHEE